LSAPAGLVAQNPEAAELRSQIESGGLEGRQAMWYVYQTRTNELLPLVAEHLFISDNPADHLQILNVFIAYGQDLEAYLPHWHLLLDRYIDDSRPPEVLLKCIELTVWWKEVRLMPALVRLTRHPRREIRVAALEGMSELQSDQIIPVLIQLITAERPVYRVYALEGLRHFGDKRMETFVGDALEDPNKSVRLFAIEAFMQQPRAEERSYLLSRRFREEDDPEVRRRIIAAFAEQNWRGQTGTINRAVQDASPLVRAGALEAAKVFKDRSTALTIARQLPRESELALKYQAVDALMYMDRSGVGHGLSALLETHEPQELRVRAALALGYLKERSGLAALASSLQSDPEEAVRIEAAGAIGAIGVSDSRAIAALERALRSPQESYAVKSAAALALKQIDSRQSLAVLRDLQYAEEVGSFRRHIQKLLAETRY